MTNPQRYIVKSYNTVSTKVVYLKVYILDSHANFSHTSMWSFKRVRANSTGPRAGKQATLFVANMMAHILNTPGIPEPLLGPFAVWQVANALWSKTPLVSAESAAPVLWDYCIEHGIITVQNRVGGS